jgi:hypothetical protein
VERWTGFDPAPDGTRSASIPRNLLHSKGVCDMRYQVRATDSQAFGRIAEMLRIEANVVLELPRRYILSVEDLTSVVRDRVEQMGGSVSPDYQYAVDPIF